MMISCDSLLNRARKCPSKLLWGRNVRRYVMSTVLALCAAMPDHVEARWMTNPARDDGFGAQYQSVLYSMVFAEYHDMEFAYSPFSKMAHNYTNDPDYLVKKEWLVNLIGHVPLAAHDLEAMDASQWPYYKFVDEHPELLGASKSLALMKTLFRENKRREDYFSSGTFNVVLHVRRPNSHDCRIEGSDVSDQDYGTVLRRLRRRYRGRRPTFHIISQGQREDFVRAFGADVTYHLNEPVEDAFCKLVFADVLLASRSSLSYMAGLLSDGDVYYLPFWHPPLAHWEIAI